MNEPVQKGTPARVLGWACLALTVAVGAGIAGFWLGVGAGWW